MQRLYRIFALLLALLLLVPSAMAEDTLRSYDRGEGVTLSRLAEPLLVTVTCSPEGAVGVASLTHIASQFSVGSGERCSFLYGVGDGVAVGTRGATS